jgi:hypothetical protein
VDVVNRHTVRVEKAGNRILVGSEGKLALKASIPGAYFRKDGFWSVPLEFESCVLLRERFGQRLVIGPSLTLWAREEKAHRAAMKTTAAALDAELRLLPDVAPFLARAMGDRTYQRVAARFIADTKGRDDRRRALIADTVGLGKSAEALAGILENGTPGPHLIICPKTAVNSTWKREINRWLPEDEVITLPDGKAAREKTLGELLDRNDSPLPQESLSRTWVVVHPYSIRTQTWWDCPDCGSPTKYTTKPIDQLDCGHTKYAGTVRVRQEHTFPHLFAMEWGSVTVDESDQILIRLTGTPNLQRRGAELLRDRVRPNGVRLAMSGTPHRSKPHNMWSTLNWLDPVRWSGKWRWVAKYWDTVNGTFGGTQIGEFREEREDMMFGELADVMLRRSRDEVRDDLPPKLYAGTPLYGTEGPIGVWLPMEGKQLKAYTEMQKTGSANIAGGEISTVGVLAEMTRLKQFAGSYGYVEGTEFYPTASGNKFEWLVGFLKEIGFPDAPATKVVVASQFTKLLKAFGPGIEKELKLETGCVGYITGEETQRRRDENVDAFEDPFSDLSLLFINTKAGGSSITLDAAEVMVILDETWVDDEQEQLEGRIDNRQPERRIVPRTYYYLRSLGSIEEAIAVGNAEAKAQGKRILNGVMWAKRYAKEHR